MQCLQNIIKKNKLFVDIVESLKRPVTLENRDLFNYLLYPVYVLILT